MLSQSLEVLWEVTFVLLLLERTSSKKLLLLLKVLSSELFLKNLLVDLEKLKFVVLLVLLKLLKPLDIGSKWKELLPLNTIPYYQQY